MCHVSSQGQDAAAKGEKAQKQNATAGQPHATLPPCWRKNLANGAIISMAGKVPSPNDTMVRKPGSAPAVLAA